MYRVSIELYTIIKLMRALWLVNHLWFIVPVNPWKFRVSSELLYKSNRPQVFMVYSLINHLWCWKNTRRIRKSLACGSWFTNSSRVLPTSRVVYQPISNGNRTEWSPIRSVIIQLITKSDDRAAGVRFVYHESYYQLIIKITISKKRRIPR